MNTELIEQRSSSESDYSSCWCDLRYFAVVRHAERADNLLATVNGHAWINSEDFRKYPHDPPVSDSGLASARCIVHDIFKLVEHGDRRIDIVATSPYYRCVQTAVEVCRELGPHVQLLLNKSLGESHSTEIFGDEEPTCVRPHCDVLSYCREHVSNCEEVICGVRPVWPETLRAARRRFSKTCQHYMQLGLRTRQNILLVSHGECVRAAAEMMPQFSQKAVSQVGFGGFVCMTRWVPGGAAQIDVPEDLSDESDLDSTCNNRWQVQVHKVKTNRMNSKSASFECRRKSLTDTKDEEAQPIPRSPVVTLKSPHESRFYSDGSRGDSSPQLCARSVSTDLSSREEVSTSASDFDLIMLAEPSFPTLDECPSILQQEEGGAVADGYL